MMPKLSKSMLKTLLFLDIETVSCVGSYEELDDALKPLWDKKAAKLGGSAQAPSDVFFDKAAVYAEFGKVIVIGMGILSVDQHDMLTLRVRALQDHDEGVLLRAFKAVLEEDFSQQDVRLCAHNGKEFDFPYLCRRMLVHDIELPHALDITGKKPWEVNHLDTMELWKFGDRKSFTSLELLAALFRIDSSKDLMHGGEVNHYYYIKKDLQSIASYCLRDVVVTAQLF